LQRAIDSLKNRERALSAILISVAFFLPVFGGALHWPWWIIFVAGSMAAIGFIAIDPRALAMLRGPSGLSLAVGF
jgi:hypothetical protein